MSLGKSLCHRKSLVNQWVGNPVTPSPVTARPGVIAGLIIDVTEPRSFGDSDSNDRAFLAAVTQMTSLGDELTADRSP